MTCAAVKPRQRSPSFINSTKFFFFFSVGKITGSLTKARAQWLGGISSLEFELLNSNFKNIKLIFFLLGDFLTYLFFELLSRSVL